MMMLARPTRLIALCFLFVAFAFVANVTLASDNDNPEEDPSEAMPRIYELLHSTKEPALKPEEALDLMKQLMAAYEKYLAKEKESEGGEDKDEKEAKKKKGWVKKVEILLEASHVTSKKCNKEALWDLQAALSYHNNRPTLYNYLLWCIGNQFAECKEILVGDLKNGASKLNSNQVEDLHELNECFKQVEDTSRDGYLEAMAMFLVKRGKEKEMLDSKKHAEFYKSTIYDLCEDLRNKLSDGFGLFEKLSTIPQVVQHLDLETQQLSEKIRLCGYITYELDPWGHSLNKLMVENSPKAPSNFDNLMRRLFARGKKRKDEQN